jgi:endonuclease/exonuclease/phosphatase (EEP) superfamily protein YafD
MLPMDSVRPGITRRPRLVVTARTLTIVGTMASVVSLFARSWWIADLIANLRIQLLIGLLAAMLCSFAARCPKLLTTSGMLLLWQASWLWTAFAPLSSFTRGPELKICTVNVLSQNTQHARIVECLKEADPDVIAVLELTSSLEQQLIRELAGLYPFRLTEPHNDGNFGIGLVSRLPLDESRLFHLSAPPVPSVEATVLWQGHTVRLIATHPVPPMNARLSHSRTLHLNLLARKIQNSRRDQPDVPCIVVGDFNLTPWSPLFYDFLDASDLRNASQGFGLSPTWYRWPLFPFGLVLDHGFCTQDFVCTRRTVHGDVGSDHRPVTFRFSRQH